VRFLGACAPTEAHTIRLLGAPFDGTVSFRPGARFGPQALRAASDGLETYSPALDRDLEDVAHADAGDLELPFGNPAAALAVIAAAVRRCLADGAKPLVLGGEHLVTLPVVEALSDHHPELVVIQLDAHADQRDDYLGERLSHACVMRRIAERLGDGHLRQIGIRSGTRAEFALMRAQGTRCSFAPEDLEALRGWLADRPVYLTLDLDVFDPGVMPATGTPEPGGIDWATFERAVSALASCRLVGADVVELAPQLDPSGCAAVVAAKCVRELLLIL
jgi:agmatinase